MERVEKRRKRLESLRMKAVQAQHSSSQDASEVPGFLPNPQLNPPASPSPAENSPAVCRFDFYADPMSNFSGNKKRSRDLAQSTQDCFLPPFVTSSATFKGTNVFLSRSLVPPETFDSLHDALRLNGASIFLCCDPSRCGPSDYHVISSPDHEKFEDLRTKGCNLLGPQCIFSCAKERRPLPKQGYTCCLAMDGVKVLASGFEKDERVKIEKLVTAMGGVLQTKTSLDVNFVIVKNVLAAKYKWALNCLKKPIVNSSWLYQCWNEHRVVPQELYRILPFTGLMICVTRIPADARKEMERLIIQNGGQYSADLTKKCTHLVSDTPEGDKYLVARRWGHINIVSKKWFDQSVARRACLDEEFYPVLGTSNSSNAVRGNLKGQHSQEKVNTTSQFIASTVIADTETTLSQSTCSAFSDATMSKKDSEPPSLQTRDGRKSDACVAVDSESEDNDLYLSDCRILLVGFQANEMRKLVAMVHKGGGTRHMSFTEKLTHIIVGAPSEIERKEVRRHASWGMINVVSTLWLEDCDREKKEVLVSEKHIVSDLLLPKESVCSSKAAAVGVSGTREAKNFISPSSMPTVQVPTDRNCEAVLVLEKDRENSKPETNFKTSNYVEAVSKCEQRSQFYSVNEDCKSRCQLQYDSNIKNAGDVRSSDVFKGRLFRFSSSFPQDRRAEIVEWVNQGGGLLVNDQGKENVHFIIECHGMIQRPANASQSTIVSSHWIRFCLEEGCMPDVGSHILYSPLPCRVPFPGFEGFRFCVSQYEEKDRLLLRNLCFVLGAKFTEKLSKKVTHLLCKFTSGPKYEAACKWEIQSVTSEWIAACVRQDRLVDLDPFRPEPVTAQDREAGLCTVSQYPTQAACMLSGDLPSQILIETQGLVKIPAQTNGTGTKNNSSRQDKSQSVACSKRARHSEDDAELSLDQGITAIKMHFTSNTKVAAHEDGSHVVPDVAAAIEDLLEQSNKIQDMKSPGKSGCDRSIFSPDRLILGQDHTGSHAAFGISKHWLDRTEKQDNHSNPCGPNRNQSTYDGFSETQSESQIVGYEEDLSGRQMIIDRVRTRHMT